MKATVTILALKRYRSAAGEWPGDLSELVQTGYLNELPMDPYSDDPLIYKRIGDEFLLYSVGPNFVDDGGEQGKLRVWADNGDRVFWPVGGSLE